jgi:signal transduction histidine kinase/CheY-like chemotaxis protein
MEGFVNSEAVMPAVPLMADSTKNEIYGAQIRALHQQLPMVLSVDVVSAGLVQVILSLRTGQSRWLIVFGLILGLASLRAVAWYVHRNSGARVSAVTWAIVATVGSGLSGLVWGLGSVFLLGNDLVEQTFLAFVIGGLCTAPLVSFSYYFPAFLAYVIPATLPLASSLALGGWTVNAAIGDMILVFAAVVTLAAYNSSRAFMHLLRLNFDLTNQGKALSTINILLEKEITYRRITQEQLHQAQKMEALGQFTGGIAHDFNNLLTGVIGYLEMASQRTADDARMNMLLQGARRAAERGAALTRQLLAFARRQRLEPRRVDVAAVVVDVQKILERTIRPDIELSVKADAGLGLAWVDPNQLELAILNLVLNSRDAMPNGGTLQIDIYNQRAESEESSETREPRDYVTVSVLDTGNGMDDATLARAFEPFFTTKEVGRGSGLGLSMVQGFVAQSGGTVRLTSALGKGTRVDLCLPRAEGGALDNGVVEVDNSVSEPNRARIVVCDDDDDVRSFVVELLRENGHTVWEANGPRIALDILKRERPIDLLLVDYAMPEMNGSAVIDRAQAHQKSLKVLLMTGYAEVLHNAEVNSVPVLAKPFKVGDLQRRIEELFNAPFSASNTTHKLYQDGACSDGRWYSLIHQAHL